MRSLSGLIDFECAARWGSFQRAARELDKTPAAVSLQVRQLEASLGFALFARHPRHIAITDKGKDLAATVSRALGELRDQVARLQAGDDELVLRVSTTHSFAMKWLVPRLHRFTARYPQLELRVDADDHEVALDTACDVAVSYAAVTPGDPDVVYQERLVVVYAPSLHRGRKSTLAELARYPLLYEDTPELWLRLFEARGLTRRHHDFSRRYSHSGLLVQAAVAGLGVALVQYALAVEDIARGRLRVCDRDGLPSRYGYRLRCSPERRHQDKVQWFEAWLRAELTKNR